jgi:hypothetical protein
MGAPLGFKTFTTGDVLTAADTNGYLMQGVWTFATAAARDAAVTSPQEGNVCYLKSTDAIMTYSGSAWVAVGGSSGLTMITSSTFTAQTAVNVNNCFSATYKRYLLMFKYAGAAAGATTFLKFRVSGADLSANYFYTAASVGLTGPTQTLIGGNNVTTGFDLGAGSQTPNYNTAIVNVQYPFVNNTQCDVHYSVASIGQSTTSMQKYATGAHNNSSSGIIDGFSLLFSSSQTGEVIVYGYSN